MEEKKDNPEEFNKKGLEYLERNLPGKAIEYFDKAIRLNDKDPTYWNNKGIAFKKLGNTDGALTFYKEALKLDPTFFLTLYNKAVIYHERKESNKAMNYAIKTIRIEPSFHKAWYIIGSTFVKQGFLEEGYRYLNEASKRCPEHSIYIKKIEKLEKDMAILELAKALDEFNKKLFQIDPECLEDKDNHDENLEYASILKSLKFVNNLKAVKTKIVDTNRRINQLVNEHEKDDKVQDDAIKCVVCLSEDRTTACMPCAHLCVCETCSKMLPQCPMCRKDIESLIRVYL